MKRAFFDLNIENELALQFSGVFWRKTKSDGFLNGILTTKKCEDASFYVYLSTKMAEKRSPRLFGDQVGRNSRFQKVDLQKIFNFAKHASLQNLYLNMPLLLFNAYWAKCNQLLPVGFVVIKSNGFQKRLVSKVNLNVLETQL